MENDDLNRGKLSATIFRTAANIIITVGLVLLGRVIYNSANGVLAKQIFHEHPASALANAYAFGLSVPVPFHVLAIGLILQRKRLPPGWEKIAKFAIVISGCWLGLALVIKAFCI